MIVDTSIVKNSSDFAVPLVTALSATAALKSFAYLTQNDGTNLPGLYFRKPDIQGDPAKARWIPMCPSTSAVVSD